MTTATETTVRYEARISRPAHDGTNYNDKPKHYEAQWIIADRITGVHLAWGDEKSVEATMQKWAKRGVPEKIANKIASAEHLKELLKPGDTIKGLVRHVSSSGMSRRISLFVAVDNEIQDITWHTAQVLEEPTKGRAGWVQDVGIARGGCGMDMVFDLVYSLSRTLFPDGFGVDGELPHGHKIRPETRDMAARAVDAGAKFRGRNGDKTGWDTDGGYALNKSSM